MLAPKKIAVVGFGEAGTIIAEGCVAAAKRMNETLECHAFDLRVADPAQRSALEEAARPLGVTLHESIGEWLNETDVVFSLVFGGAAKQVALDILPNMRNETAYIDLTTSVPKDMREAADAFAVRTVEFIDGTALGSFRTNGVTVPFVLSGEGAEKWSTWMNSLGFNTRPVPGGAGNASNVKLLRSVLAKGLEALGIECFVAADKMGLRESMAGAFNDFDLRPMVVNLEDMGGSHITHCKRRLAEIDHALNMLAEAGVDGIMTKASRAFYARTAASGETTEPGQGATWNASMEAFHRMMKP